MLCISEAYKYRSIRSATFKNHKKLLPNFLKSFHSQRLHCMPSRAQNKILYKNKKYTSMAHYTCWNHIRMEFESNFYHCEKIIFICLFCFSSKKRPSSGLVTTKLQLLYINPRFCRNNKILFKIMLTLNCCTVLFFFSTFLFHLFIKNLYQKLWMLNFDNVCMLIFFFFLFLITK